MVERCRVRLDLAAVLVPPVVLGLAETPKPVVPTPRGWLDRVGEAEEDAAEESGDREEAARALGLARSTLVSKLKKYGIP